MDSSNVLSVKVMRIDVWETLVSIQFVWIFHILILLQHI